MKYVIAFFLSIRSIWFDTWVPSRIGGTASLYSWHKHGFGPGVTTPQWTTALKLPLIGGAAWIDSCRYSLRRGSLFGGHNTI
jgi:hypothetical protein